MFFFRKKGAVRDSREGFTNKKHQKIPQVFWEGICYIVPTRVFHISLPIMSMCFLSYTLLINAPFAGCVGDI